MRRGIYVDGIYDIGRIENVHWNPWWSMKPALFNRQKENGEPNDWLRSICVDKLYYNPDGTIQKMIQTGE